MSNNIMNSLIEAMAYAQNRINKEKSEDPDIINEICSNICNTKSVDDCNSCKTGIHWKENNQNKMWPSDQGRYFGPPGGCDPTINNCSNGLNCIKKLEDDQYYCGFNSDEIPAGNTVITNKQTCINLSTPVYTCPTNASSLDDCTSTVKNASTGSDGLRYVEWREDNPVDPNNKYGGKCVYGNFTLKAYAEFPQSHSMAKKEGGVPKPFYYDQDNGKMYITPEYCHYFGLEYGTGSKNNADSDDSCKGTNSWRRTDDCNLIGGTCRHICISSDTEKTPGYYGAIKCTTDADCPNSDPSFVKGEMTKARCLNVDKSNPDNKICIGDSSDCFTTTTDEVLEMLVGNTLFNAIEGTEAMGDCVKNTVNYIFNDTKIKENYNKQNIPSKQNSENINNMFSNFNKISDQVSKIADSKYMESKKILMKDYAGKGVNLYLIKWDLKATKLGIPSINDIGFDYDEIIKKYPEICTQFKDTKFISINKKQLTNNDIKRIYVYIGSNGWIKEMINNLDK
jgi:hypothetical protein